MESQYRIFYSWQSDNSEAKDIVGRALNNVVKKLKTERISLKIEQGGGGCGFISIEESVRIKIRRSDIFVGDVTPVGNVKRRKKLLPNANVMYEMGLATECMAPERVLAVAMDGDWKIENMPFDFNHNTMLKFDKEKGEQSFDVNPESWTQLSGFSCIKNIQEKNGRRLLIFIKRILARQKFLVKREFP